MNYKSLLVPCVLMTLLSVKALYRIAQEQDIPALLTLIQTAEADKDKIVILPEQFREMALEDAIRKKRLFVAEHDKALIGYKKLFIIKDPKEKDEILYNELRVANKASYLGIIDNRGIFTRQDSVQPEALYDLCIYNGADYTQPAHRGHGINTHLTAYALESLKPDLEKYIAQTNARFITLLYGITHDNAGNNPGEFPDRSIGISKLFRNFVESLPHSKPEASILHMRFKAAKPSFDLHATELKPLPDDQAVPGFGCVLAYQLGAS